jgi:hypothetical protein
MDILRRMSHRQCLVGGEAASGVWKNHTMKMLASPIPLPDSRLADVHHGRAFFISPEAEYRALLILIEDGFRAWRTRWFALVKPDQRPSIGNGWRRSDRRRDPHPIRQFELRTKYENAPS